jgi:hypothetical protein
MNLSWLDGGLYYPRNDRREDDHGRRTLLEPMTGNVLLGYARLNVEDGLWRLYNEPWDRAHHAQPALQRVADDIDVTRALFDRAANVLAFTLQRRDDRTDDGAVLVGNLAGRGGWVLEDDGRTVARGDARSVTSADGADVRAEAEGIAIRCPRGGSHAYAMRFDTAPARTA